MILPSILLSIECQFVIHVATLLVLFWTLRIEQCYISYTIIHYQMTFQVKQQFKLFVTTASFFVVPTT